VQKKRSGNRDFKNGRPMISRKYIFILAVTTLLSFSACGGGAGGVTIGPPETTYTIGGTVSGLSGAGFKLLDNGTDGLLIGENGTFVFEQPIDSGAAYDVSVGIEPTSLQFCVVTNGSGTANANITNVLVNCTTPVEQDLYSFGKGPDGNTPGTNLLFDGSGNLYGTTHGGGLYDKGTVFTLTPNNGQWTETVIYSFCPQLQNCVDGAIPDSGLVFDAGGNLYGTTTAGGAYGVEEGSTGGVVFELTPHAGGTWTEKVLHSFGQSTDGNGPISGLVFDSTGNLYGTTFSGGTTTVCPAGCGTVFELSPGLNGQWEEKVLYSFCSQAECTDGNQPLGTVVLDSSGNIYGTTASGGTSPSPDLNGTVFELSPGQGAEWAETVLYSFQGGSTDGSGPQAGVILDKSGNLYGTTEYGYEAVGINNGIVFELTRESGSLWKENVLYGFCASPDYCSDGASPYAALAFDKAGNLYGTTFLGGAFGTYGVVFGLTPGAAGSMWNEVPLYSLEGSPFGGGNPSGGLILDAAGNLYGTAGGGVSGNGVVFEVTP
jgi:uncharacterized repeat protein (TIGR03803 family)